MDVTELRSDNQELGGAVDVLRADLNAVTASLIRVEQAFRAYIKEDGGYFARSAATDILDSPSAEG